MSADVTDVINEKDKNCRDDKKPVAVSPCCEKRLNSCEHDKIAILAFDRNVGKTVEYERSSELKCSSCFTSPKPENAAVSAVNSEGRLNLMEKEEKALDCSDEDVDIVGSDDTEVLPSNNALINGDSCLINGHQEKDSASSAMDCSGIESNKSTELHKDNFEMDIDEELTQSTDVDSEMKAICENSRTSLNEDNITSQNAVHLTCANQLEVCENTSRNKSEPKTAEHLSIAISDKRGSTLNSEVISQQEPKSVSALQVLKTSPCGTNKDRGCVTGNTTSQLMTSDYSISLDDEDEEDDFDPYNRFFFESDYLALKENEHYQSLLQILVVLEGQRIQAIKDLDILCEEEAKALDDPIEFVEKLQNNESLSLPERQKVARLPPIPWDEYADALGPIEKAALSSYHHTRTATQNLEKAAFSAVQSCSVVPSSSGVPSTSSASMFSKTSPSTERGSHYTLGREGRNIKMTETFNQPWTKEEQSRLEKLLQVFPQEEVEAKRWEKIAKALGNRSMKQVASRVQKYFIKLTKAGLPVPGRVPNVPKPGNRSKRTSHYSTMGFRTSTFFPSYQPRVYMDEDHEDGDTASFCYSEDTCYISDDESVSPELRDTPEYQELMELKSARRHKLQHLDQSLPSTSAYQGFMCDGCGDDPIIGTRYHCRDCPTDSSVDFCSSCMERNDSRLHNPTHRLEPAPSNHGNPSCYVDGDYVGMDGSTGAGYNYLDPNFLPAVS